MTGFMQMWNCEGSAWKASKLLEMWRFPWRPLLCPISQTLCHIKCRKCITVCSISLQYLTNCQWRWVSFYCEVLLNTHILEPSGFSAGWCHIGGQVRHLQRTLRIVASVGFEDPGEKVFKEVSCSHTMISLAEDPPLGNISLVDGLNTVRFS